MIGGAINTRAISKLNLKTLELISQITFGYFNLDKD